MATHITSNGSKWAGGPPDDIDTLLRVLAEHPLRWEQRPFTSVERDDSVRFHGNFATVSHVFQITTDEPGVIARLTAAIEANMRRADYLAQAPRTLATFKTLADFKRALAMPGAIVRVLLNEVRGRRADEQAAAYMAEASAGRTVRKLQGNAVCLNSTQAPNGAWLYFGKASDWSFADTEATVTIEGKRIVYTVEAQS